MVYDFHSHILPGVDDGAKDIKTAKEMLLKSADSGVGAVISTSHCYPYSEHDIESFINRRDKSFSDVEGLDSGIKLYKGCEVHLTGDLTKFKNIRKLCINSTDYMLLEMPMTAWNDTVIDNVYKLTLMGITPIIAHNERNNHQKKEIHSSLLDLDVLIQINAQSLWDRAFKKDIDKLLRMGMVHIIGTDMHNLDKRKPCMAKAQKIVSKRYGKVAWEYLMNNAEKVLNGTEISYREFKSFKKKLLF